MNKKIQSNDPRFGYNLTDGGRHCKHNRRKKDVNRSLKVKKKTNKIDILVKFPNVLLDKIEEYQEREMISTRAGAIYELI